MVRHRHASYASTPGIRPGTQCREGLVGSRACLDGSGEEKLSCLTVVWTPTEQPADRQCTYYAIPDTIAVYIFQNVINITLDESCLREMKSCYTASHTETQHYFNHRLPKLTNITLDFALLPLSKTGSQIVDRGHGFLPLKIKAV